VLARLAMLPPLLALALAGGCDNTFIAISSDGRILVVVSTTGSSVDPDGFSVSVDGDTARFVPPNSEIALTGLSEGTHSVFLSGIADNCQVDGSNPRSVVVGSDGQANVAFSVVCAAATTGGFTIIVSTTGTPVDPDGYLLSVAGTMERAIEVDGRETYTGLTPGVHLIALKDVATGCALEGGNPQPFTVVVGKTVEVRLTVLCGGGSA
jgi:hypothetical protein